MSRRHSIPKVCLMITEPKTIITDEDIERVHGNANFGPVPKRDIVNEALLKYACGYHNGSTARQIIIEHGLVKPGRSTGRTALTKKGREYLYAVYSKGML